MQSFLKEITNKLLEQGYNISDMKIVLPSKRAGNFLLKSLSEKTTVPFFAPEVVSIEEFIQEISGLKIISQSDLLLESYQIHAKDNTETFEEYLNWAETVLSDFNEIDRYLIPPNQFFSYLSEIKILEKWGVNDSENSLAKKYFQFWKTLYGFYQNLNHELSKKQLGYQGMVYRKAAEDIEHYLQSNLNINHWFVGFNALNNAEQHIIQELLENKLAEVFWDNDAHFVNDAQHSAGLFLRRYLANWKHYARVNYHLESQYNTPKNIQLIAAQNEVSQVKYVGNLLAEMPQEKQSNTAIVLADESLLISLLYSIPKNIAQVNITMGVSLQSHPIVNLFYSIGELYRQSTASIYYKQIETILGQSIVKLALQQPEQILSLIREENLSYLTQEKLLELSDEKDYEILKLLFPVSEVDATTFVASMKSLLERLINVSNLHFLEKIVLQNLEGIFTEIEKSLTQFKLPVTPLFCIQLFDQLIASTSLDLEGDPYKGLQIMGILETRVLDFEHIIMLSVNEGVLPSGKSTASFITYDLKKQFGLPSYPEKDAVYAYHFFRLLQRAKHITLLYSEGTHGLSIGEKSRFIRQLEIEALTHHSITTTTLHQPVVFTNEVLMQIKKNESIISRLEEIAQKGFSPSALTSYIRDPYTFYKERILKVKEIEEVEETVAYNTLGNVVHETLEILYTPFIGSLLSIESLKLAKKNAEEQVRKQFDKHFKLGDYTQGKNLLIYEVAKRYVQNLIQWDLNNLETGNEIEIIALEKNVSTSLPKSTTKFSINLRGTVDRIDRYNGVLRVIDYKSGLVKQSDVEVVDWETIIKDYKYSKAFQVLTYAYMLHQVDGYQDIEAGIVSFKNFQSGFLKFGKKESTHARKKAQWVTQEVLKQFEEQLLTLIEEICDPDIPFVEKELDK